jgi:hypothetical protein
MRRVGRCSLPTALALSGLLPVWVLIAASAVSAGLAAQPAADAQNLAAILTRVGAHVEEYYTRARSIICTETVHLQPLTSGMSWDGLGRQLVYELRVLWEPSMDGDSAAEANVLRQLVKVNGRPPKPKDEPGCLDPKSVSPEPLAMLLPSRQRQYAFKWAGTDRIDGRATIRIDYRGVERKPAEITWKDDCVSVDLPGRTRGRIWFDAQTDDIVRLDEELTGMFEFPVPNEHWHFSGPRSMVIERADSSIRYKPVAFHDPDETIMLPASIQSVQIVRNAGTPRLRTTQQFSDYKRFLTTGRVKEPGTR